MTTRDEITQREPRREDYHTTRRSLIVCRTYVCVFVSRREREWKIECRINPNKNNSDAEFGGSINSARAACVACYVTYSRERSPARSLTHVPLTQRVSSPARVTGATRRSLHVGPPPRAYRRLSAAIFTR